MTIIHHNMWKYYSKSQTRLIPLSKQKHVKSLLKYFTEKHLCHEAKLLFGIENRFQLSTMNYLPGTASLIEEIDKKLLVVLRDGRTLIGILRSIDQFANLVLHRTIERIHVGKKYGDIPRGIFIVRGENVVLLGEIDLTNEDNHNLEQVPIDEILEMQRDEQILKQEEEEKKKKSLIERGLQPHTDYHEDLY